MYHHPLVMFVAALWLLMFLPVDKVLVTSMRLKTDRPRITLDKLRGLSFDVKFHQPSKTGQPFYRILNKIKNTGNEVVYIGGNETLIKLSINATNSATSIYTTDLVTDEPPLIVSCDQKSTDPEKECWNFIRVAEETSSSGSYVCGTNSQSALCYLCSQDLMNCSSVSGAAPKLVPLLPGVNPSAAVFNQDGSEILYGGDANSDTFQRYGLSADGSTTFELDTVTVGLQFINEAVFVGKPFPFTDSSDRKYIFTFYRERAEEYSNLGEKLYSRIARVCQNDTGGPVNTQKFVTFIKARLNCSIPDDLLPYEFSEIQDVLWTDGNEGPEAYAVFTSPTNGPEASALCRYRMVDIMKLFDEGESKLQLGGNVNRQWLPILLENPRPGTCDEVHTTDYPPLLDKLVPNYNPLEPAPGDQPPPPANLKQSDAPTLYVDGVHFTSLAIDIDNCTYYFGTTTGSVIKAFKYNCNSAAEPFKTIEITELGTSGTTVTGLELISKGNAKFLVVTTEESVITWRTERTVCSGKCMSECEELGPGCVWRDNRCQCVLPYDCINGDSSGTSTFLVQPDMSSIRTLSNSEVVLLCQVDFGSCPERPVNLSWVQDHNDSFVNNNNHLVKLTKLSDKLLELRLRVIHNKSNGSYTCTAQVGDKMETRQVQVEADNRLTEDGIKLRCDHYQELERNKPVVSGDTCSVDIEECSSCYIGHQSDRPPF
ncbi:semaphorin-2A-like [Acanthaster planci]|uniref:Semaphorin-2A-like n=1 Tax=Acanthaster planci TaxID=133434 RepID=A0A8B7ZRK1_ACAPL|nr:semaphorin-2A-like [Acanthaster planci]